MKTILKVNKETKKAVRRLSYTEYLNEPEVLEKIRTKKIYGTNPKEIDETETFIYLEVEETVQRLKH